MSTTSKPRGGKKAAAAAATAAAATTPAPENQVVETPKKSRSTKKTPPVVAFVGPTGITGSFMNEQRPLIAHIPVSSVSIAFDGANIMKYDPVVPDVPKAYDSKQELSYLDGIPEGSGVCSDAQAAAGEKQEEHEEYVVEAVQEVRQEPVQKATTTGHTVKCKLPTYYSEKLMVLFQDANRYQKLPEKTEIACFWCCHGFASHPCAIPSHIMDEVWYMYGNFCSPECATAYLFKERIDNHVQWERYALLNSLYTDDADIKANSSYGIRPAPPREILRMFGGTMDIGEYRALVHEKRLRVDVMTPPMVSIVQTMDTKPIDFYDQNIKNVFARGDIQHKYNAPGAQGLRLRRTKPLKSRESTVEWAMQIQHITSS
jgi:hypothetical protein